MDGETEACKNYRVFKTKNFETLFKNVSNNNKNKKNILTYFNIFSKIILTVFLRNCNFQQ